MDWQEILTPAILFVLTVIVFPLVRQWIQKIRDERLRGLAEDAVGFAEQEARKHLKGHGTKMNGEVKKNLALEHVIEQAKEKGIVVDEARASKLVESALGTINLKT